jgi:hypothetical protein
MLAGTVDLAMSTEEVLALTHRQLLERIARLEVVEKRKGLIVEIMVGQLAAMVANTGFRGFDRLRQPSEFMPSMRKSLPEGQKPRKRRRRKDIADNLRCVMQSFT